MLGSGGPCGCITEAYAVGYCRRMSQPGRDALTHWVADADTITVLTGAGISTDSGIPDFRGPNGVWTQNPGAAALFTLQNYVADPQARRRAWQTRREHPAWTARPNAAHRALVELERAGRLRAIVTQNIDGLHQRAGSGPERVIEIHGSLSEVVCLDCGERSPMRTALERVESGEPDPDCRRCGGILKSATISFGQAMDRATLRGWHLADRAASGRPRRPGAVRRRTGRDRQRPANAVRRRRRHGDPRADRSGCARRHRCCIDSIDTAPVGLMGVPRCRAARDSPERVSASA
jgi:NAD-dependent deacetylase